MQMPPRLPHPGGGAHRHQGPHAGHRRGHHQWYIFYTLFPFEFDEQKSQANLDKHGIDFVQAQELWSDPYLIEIPAKTVN